eukprot:CAMPEP_0182416974 /NCGR_PEP_ID=MMETSP1167-20130531/1397_1 /TAXON_ID=2988 /ORGANISM="Mallomonas Sp, Strain CCMP3275" /LENGTH=322 /DNA_ID=CAMNT_0024590205 /DNA_START=566 /DNA_END=1531 /DNA_ORIENTATION=-
MTEKDVQSTLLQLEALINTHNIQIVAVALNAFTFHTALPILNWVTQSNKSLHTIGTDLLRGHARRPGVLSSVRKGHSPSHFSSSSSSLSSSSSSVDNVSASSSSSQVPARLEELKAALDHCLHMEKQFLEKLKCDSVKSEHVCWGHILTSAQDTLLYPEEWRYLKYSQVDVQWEEARKVLMKLSKAHKDWDQLHSTLLRQTFPVFEAMLEARKTDLLLSICDKLYSSDISDIPSSSRKEIESNRVRGIITPYELPEVLAQLVEGTGLCDHIILSGAVVAPDLWQTEYPTAQGTTEDRAYCVSQFSVLRSVLEEFKDAEDDRV